jgi:hypothetical protein
MAVRWLDGGFYLYVHCGRYALLVGPALWTTAMLSPLLHRFLLTISLSVVVLYYNMSVNNGLRRLVKDQPCWPRAAGESVRDD